jgi:hypothetical protein
VKALPIADCQLPIGNMAIDASFEKVRRLFKTAIGNCQLEMRRWQRK